MKWMVSSSQKMFLWVIFCCVIFVFVYSFRDGLSGSVSRLQTAVFPNDDAKHSVSVNIFANETDIENPLTFTTIQQPVFPELLCNIVDFGAVSDGVQKNTLAFEKAIEHCANHGGGSVIVPAGKWITGPIHFKNNINLRLDKDAEILFSTDLNDYLPVVFSRFEGVEYYNYSPPLYAIDCKNIAITGEGTLNGMSKDSWWKFNDSKGLAEVESIRKSIPPVDKRVFGEREAGLRPPFIQFVNCKNILLEGFTLINSPMWAINPVYSEDIVVRGVNVNTEGGGQNNDGIDIDSSRNVLIENSFFNTGDDAIAIKSGSGKEGMRVNKPSENIVIRNTKALNGHAGVAIGSEISGSVRNVFVYNNSFERSQYGFRLKTTLVDGGTVENVWVKNVDMKNLFFNAIEIANDYGTKPLDGEYFPPTIRNIHVEDITCNEAKGAISLRGSERASVSDLFFKNITVSSRSAVTLTNASRIELDTIAIDSKHESNVTNIKGLTVTDYICPKTTAECLRINGSGNENINLTESTVPSNKILFIK